MSASSQDLNAGITPHPEKSDAPRGDRTRTPLFKRQVLCPLSFRRAIETERTGFEPASPCSTSKCLIHSATVPKKQLPSTVHRELSTVGVALTRRLSLDANDTRPRFTVHGSRLKVGRRESNPHGLRSQRSALPLSYGQREARQGWRDSNPQSPPGA